MIEMHNIYPWNTYIKHYTYLALANNVVVLNNWQKNGEEKISHSCGHLGLRLVWALYQI